MKISWKSLGAFLIFLGIASAFAADTGTLNLGTAAFIGTSSGTVSMKGAAAAGTWTFTLPTSGGSSNQFLQTDGSGTTTWATASGSGTVNSGTSGQLAYYASSTNAVSGAASATISSGTLQLGASGTAGSVVLGNGTSGLLTINTVTGALGTITASFPVNTGTVAETNFAQTWTAAQTFGSVIGTTTVQTGTGASAYTLASTDCGTMVQFSGALPTVTIPNTLPAGCSISMEQTGAGAVTLAAAAGATLHKAFTTGATRAQYSVIGITIEGNSGGSSAVAVMWGDGA